MRSPRERADHVVATFVIFAWIIATLYWVVYTHS